MGSPTAFGEPCEHRKPARNPSKPETLPNNILRNLHGQHEATYAQECVYHLPSPLLMLLLVLVLLPLDWCYRYWCRGTVLSPSATKLFAIRSGTIRLEPGLDPPATHPEPWSLARNLPLEPSLPGTSLKPFPRACPGTFPEPSSGTCPGTFPEPCRGTLPGSCPGTRVSEAAPAPPRNVYWLRPHS